jgi:predicted amidohydrolase YtcJ
MRSISRLAALAAAAVIAATPAAAQTHCTLYTARKIITMDPSLPVATAVAELNGRILAVGNFFSVNDSTRGQCVPDGRFAQQVIMPGFVEAHAHLQMYGFFNGLPYAGYYQRTNPDGSIRPGLTSWGEVQRYLRNALESRRRAGNDTAMYAYGTDPIYWGGRLTAALLDEVSTEIPILLQLGSGHIVVGNTPMMRLLMADTAKFNPLLRAGYVVTGADGRPTGELDELAAVNYAIEVLRQHAPGYFTPAAAVQAIQQGAGMMHRAGITTGTDLFFGGSSAEGTLAERLIYMDQAAKGLPVRVALGYNAFGLAQSHDYDPQRMVEALERAQLMDNDHVWTGPVKIVFDGSIQGYTAQLDSPPSYFNPVGKINPIWNIAPNQLDSLMRPFWEAGFSIAIHANGDSATQQVVRAARRLRRPRNGQAISVQHNQMGHLADFVAMKPDSLAMHTNLFTPHIYFYGKQHVEYTMGAQRASIMDNVRWADSLGIPYALHTDAPVTPGEPLMSAWTAVARTTCTGEILGTASISVDRALYAITMGAATLLARQDSIGSIQRGKWADFTVLDRDPSVPDGSALLTARVVATVLGGRVQPVTNPSARTPQPACSAGPR